MKDKLLYICYSLPQRKFLSDNGVRYEIGGKSIKTDCPFWVYERNEKLDNLLNEWSKNKK